MGRWQGATKEHSQRVLQLRSNAANSRQNLARGVADFCRRGFVARRSKIHEGYSSSSRLAARAKSQATQPFLIYEVGSSVILLSQPGSPANTRRAARSSTWVKVASASNRWRTWLSTHEARRVEVERAKRRGCLTRSVKLAQLVRYCSFSAEAVTIARSAAPLRACPRRSTWPITGRRGRSWARKTPNSEILREQGGFASGAAAPRRALTSPR